MESEYARVEKLRADAFKERIANKPKSTMPYNVRHAIETRQHGKVYEYEIDIPALGCILNVNYTGYGNGSRQSYLVVDRAMNKKYQVNRLTVCPVYFIDDPAPGECQCDMTARFYMTISPKKDGASWKWVGEASYRGESLYSVQMGVYAAPEDIDWGK